MQIERHLASGCATTRRNLARRRVTISAGLWQPTDATPRPEAVIVPADWSDAAAQAFARIACYKGRLPRHLKPIGATNVPQPLWRSGIDRAATRAADPEQRFHYEHDAFAVIDRISGSLAYWGWRLGYFDQPEDAQSFRDELAALLTTRRLVPGPAIWANMGLHWAYGINELATDDDNGRHRGGYGLSADQQQVDRLDTLVERPPLADLRVPGNEQGWIDATTDAQNAMAVLGEAGRSDLDSLNQSLGQAVIARVLNDLTEALRTRPVNSLVEALGDPVIGTAASHARQAGLPDTVIARAIQLAAEDRLDRLDAWLEQAGRLRDLDNSDRPASTLGLADALLEQALDAMGQQDSVSGETGEAAQALLSAEQADAIGLIDAMAWTGWTTGQPASGFVDTARGWSNLGDSPLAMSADGAGCFLSGSAMPQMTVMASAFLDFSQLDDAAPLDARPGFDIDGFVQSCRIGGLALDIALSAQHWPTEAGAIIARDHRPVALSLGSLTPILDQLDIAYDSAAARHTMAGLVALMGAIATGGSAELAQKLGPCPAYESHADGIARVTANRARAAAGLSTGYQGLDILPVPLDHTACTLAGVAEAASTAWRDVLQLIESCGLRNLHTTCLPTMGDVAMLAGAAPHSLAPAPARLIDAGTSALAQIDMLAACQPYLSGGIAMTVAVEAETGLDATADLILKGWRRGLKHLRLFRTAGPSDQPWRLPVSPQAVSEEPQPTAPEAAPVSAAPETATATTADAPGRVGRKTMPPRRKGYTQKATVGGHKLYLRTGEYEDGSLGEIFIDMHKEGAAFRSLMNNFAVAISIGLQYGVPLEEFVEAFTFTRFEPAGPVEGNEAVKMATSVLDYMFRELAISYLGRDDLAHARPEDIRHDSLGTGDQQGDLPAAPDAGALLRRLASSGYLRDQLHHHAPARNDSGNAATLERRTAQAMAMGFLSEPCAHCGSLTLMQQPDNSTACRTCGAQQQRHSTGTETLV